MPAAPWPIRRLALIGAVAAAAPCAHAAATFTPDLQPTGWVTRPVLSSFDLTSGNEVIYRADYRAGEWSGALRANLIEANGNIKGNSPWVVDNASMLLDAVAHTDRRIVTRLANGSGTPLRWDSLDSAQRTALGDATLGPKILDFVRGDRSNEDPGGSKFRRRSTVLGDTQHSTLVHWRYPDGARRLFVGANDGMLHVFDASTGNEVFAYVPSMLISRLPLLTANPYTHKLYVDGPLAAADVMFSGVRKTFLAGGLGGGGRGLFMLDISDPTAADEAAAAAKLKWEITPASTGFANLGYTYAMPRFARLNNGTAVIVVGNGYLNTGNGRASLFIINADTGALVREIDTGQGTVASPNGLSSPTLVDTNGDGKVDYAYAGDIDGQMWKFDLRETNPASFSASSLFTTSPLQAITVAPVIHKHPLGGWMVLFGTGRTLTAADSSDTAVFAAYGIWDGAPPTNTTLLAQSVSATSYGGQPLRYASSNAPNWAAGGHRGWRTPLPAGERVVGESPFLNDDRFYFMSTNPTVPSAGEGRPPGEGWLTELNFLSGGNPSASIYDINDDGLIDTNDRVSGQVISAKGLGAGIHSQPVLVDLATRSLTIFSQQSDVTTEIPPGTPGDPGVSGGHFDVDLYDRSSGTYAKRKHVHEYDDKFDVTGVNFLNASDTGFNLSNAIAATVPFKVLVMNQILSPAVQLQVGGQPWASVKTYGALASATDAAAVLAAQSVYTRNGANFTLKFKLPLDAFKSKDWWGTGDVRAGLIPTQTGCVNRIANATTGATGTPGPNGERFNGALTIQLVKSDTTASHLELNNAAGGAAYGWRVKAANFSQVLAEYTVFWHHPNGKCYGASGWVKDAPQDFDGGGKTATRAAGSDDPSEGEFGGNSPPPGVSIVSATSSVSGDVTTYLVNYSDGTTQTTRITNNGDGTETVTIIDVEGNTSEQTRTVGGSAISGVEEILVRSRRINWREVVRP